MIRCSGLILMYTRSFRRGDYVRIGDNEGTVLELGMFITRIRTGLGEEISLPNATVMATPVPGTIRAPCRARANGRRARAWATTAASPT